MQCTRFFQESCTAPCSCSPQVDPLPLASISLGLGGLLAGARARHFSKTWRPWLRRGVLGAGVRVPCRALATEVAPKVLADDAEVRAPPGDPRQYRVLQLDNGLQVLLASDPSASTAAAALTVRCGTFQDSWVSGLYF